MKPEHAELGRPHREDAKFKTERDLLGSAAAFATGVDVRFGFMGIHRGTCPMSMMCETL
jgi:hypothetical protein